MPNHVPCVLTVEGDGEQVQAFIEFAQGPKPHFSPSDYDRAEMDPA